MTPAAQMAWTQLLIGGALVAGAFMDVPFYLGIGAVLAGLGLIVLVREYRTAKAEAARQKAAQALVTRAMEANIQEKLARAADLAPHTQGH